MITLYIFRLLTFSICEFEILIYKVPLSFFLIVFILKSNQIMSKPSVKMKFHSRYVRDKVIRYSSLSFITNIPVTNNNAISRYIQPRLSSPLLNFKGAMRSDIGILF
uniref:Uncharacterized protein n=1 Tax=Cacopsylla melanoneura TaxID=428564 RepID=A0A8D8W2S8_9HEMI